MREPSKEIELHPALVFDCDKCGKENFVRPIRAEMTSEEYQEAKAEYDLPDLVDGQFLMAPEQVTCSKCGTSFKSKDDDGPVEMVGFKL